MLGRRAAVLIAFASLSAFGGGVALAATHGSSHSSKPKTSTSQKSTPKMAPRSGHNCPNMGASSSAAPASAGV
jgi:hypothetical protein